MAETQNIGSTHDIECEGYRTTKGDTELPDDSELSPAFNEEFQERFRKAFLSMIQSSKYVPVLGYFRSAYEYRKQFPWLGESKNTSGESNQDGLSYALQAALATYIVSSPIITEPSPGGRNIPERHRKRSDSEWTGRLAIAAEATIDEAFSLERFENRLSRGGVNVNTITPRVLQEHIAEALTSYYNRRMIGTAPDPF